MASLWALILLISTTASFVTESKAQIKVANKPSKPALILIPAAFSKASVCDIVKRRLQNVGFDVVAIDLPSAGPRAAEVDRTHDIQVVQEAISQCLSAGKNIVLVGNSYGATVICDAVKEFANKSSPNPVAPASGKILGLIFVRLPPSRAANHNLDHKYTHTSY
jgi:pimeloyl-ACP methyl ester carboxylesterase